MDMFSKHDQERAVMQRYDGLRECDAVPKAEDIGITCLQGDGDFRSPECVEFLKQSDIVVTNPPFSLFREYVAQLMEHDRKFIIIGNKNAITYREIFPLIQQNKIWAGHTPMGKDLLFDLPEDFAAELLACKKDGSSYRIVDGVVKGRSQSIWYTNLSHSKRHEELYLSERHDPQSYPKYDNHDAINVDEIRNIPRDWKGVMGVPITFLDKYNPDQFEILGITKTWFGAATKTYPSQVQISANGKRSEVSKLNDGAALRIMGPIDKTYYVVEGNYYKQAYARILIRNRNPEK